MGDLSLHSAKIALSKARWRFWRSAMTLVMVAVAFILLALGSSVPQAPLRGWFVVSSDGGIGIGFARQPASLRWWAGRSPTLIGVVHRPQFFMVECDGGAVAIACFFGGPLFMVYRYVQLALADARYLRIRNAIPTHCTSCGYDLAGLPSERPCPECGSARPA